MLSGTQAARRFARWAQRVLAVVALLVMAVPAMGAGLGPLGLVARELGRAHEHLCKCGMAPGKCGCPECARLERERDQAPSPVPVLKGDCDDHPSTAPLAGIDLAIPLAARPLPPSPTGQRIAASVRPAAHLGRDPSPPTPPPRLGAV